MAHTPLGFAFAGGFHDEIDEFVASSAIASPSPLARRLMQLCGDRSVDTAELAEVLEADSSLAARIIKAANTTRQGAGIPATNMMAAVNRLGRNRCLCLALASEVAEAVSWSVGPHFDFPRFWRDSLARGCIARTIVMHCQSVLAGPAFLSALLQDLGVALLAARFGPRYAAILRRRREPHRRLAVFESQAFKFNHIHVVARLLERWGAPRMLVEAVGRHHARPPLQRGVPSRLLLWQVNYFVGAMSLGRDCPAPLGESEIAEMPRTTFGIGGAMLAGVFGRAAQQFADAEDLFRSWLPRDMDVEHFFSAAARPFSGQPVVVSQDSLEGRKAVGRVVRGESEMNASLLCSS